MILWHLNCCVMMIIRYVLRHILRQCLWIWPLDLDKRLGEVTSRKIRDNFHPHKRTHRIWTNREISINLDLDILQKTNYNITFSDKHGFLTMSLSLLTTWPMWSCCYLRSAALCMQWKHSIKHFYLHTFSYFTNNFNRQNIDARVSRTILLTAVVDNVLLLFSDTFDVFIRQLRTILHSWHTVSK